MPLGWLGPLAPQGGQHPIVDDIYASAWVDFLVEKLGDAATHELIVRGTV